ncbi:MAG TPA: 23S rRNA (guanosine(2251)-2'-O)-methyltransferase RlmB [Stellaceae bacterium]|jgi:23S rRNA (guanosine2251-2'-O)-methyltransferase|nr:23S rRNA (guanosine(2251)-2'-O)-methyltransferase RlmB [Stellaceae bacterium]
MPERAPPPEPRRDLAIRTSARPHRDTGGWIYGRHAVRAALRNPARRLRRLVATPELAAEAQAWLAEAKARSAGELKVETLERGRLEALLPEAAVHQGLALQAEPLPPAFLEDMLAEIPPTAAAGTAVVVVLDQVSDPQNVGAVLRSAAAFGALGLVLPEHGTPPSTSALAKAASGALEQVPLVRVTNLARALDKLKQAGFWCVGLEESAEKLLGDLDLSGRVALVLGAEGEGLRRLTRERCDFLARLPTHDALASLNVSNAAAIALYEVARRRPP